MLIDRISYRNSIKNINPIIKIFLAFIVLIFAPFITLFR